jgi:D-alanyl-D-alanine carboxypeptidase/D-alanyl-D-alanine-endopeptidase (penicillin-binding protein 4)
VQPDWATVAILNRYTLLFSAIVFMTGIGVTRAVSAPTRPGTKVVPAVVSSAPAKDPVRAARMDALRAARRAATLRLDRSLADVISTRWRKDKWSVLVVSLEDGDTLFAHNPHAALEPASNLKLFTTSAAFHYLGPDYRFVTYLAAVGTIHDGVLDGDLVIYGTGDPTLSHRFYDSRTAVWDALADSLRHHGVREIRGDVVGDASYFGDPGFGPGWRERDVGYAFAAPASALSFNDNVVTMHITPARKVGDPPELHLYPGADGLAIQNRAVTVARGRVRLAVSRASYDGPIVVRGSIGQNRTGEWRSVPVEDPAHYAAAVLTESLRQAGIAVHGVARSIGPGEASPITGRHTFAPSFQDAKPVQVLVTQRSPRLQKILEIINRRSDNLYAEMVLRAVGRIVMHDGTAHGGARAVEAMLAGSDSAQHTLEMVDGSGLSGLNRTSAATIIGLLQMMAASPNWDNFRATLPEAGNRHGLRRMYRTKAQGNLRAKTGTLRDVSALSGYVRAEDGELLAFSIISNHVPSTWRAKRIEDRIGARLAAFARPTLPDTDALDITDDVAQ